MTRIGNGSRSTSTRTNTETTSRSVDTQRSSRTTSTNHSFSTGSTRSTTSTPASPRSSVTRNVASQPQATNLQNTINRGDYVRKGQEGNSVSELQGLLNRAGSQLSTDGKFGDKTDQALRGFQTSNGLKADGLVGSDTLRTLLAAPPQTSTRAPRTVERPNPAAQPTAPAPAAAAPAAQPAPAPQTPELQNAVDRGDYLRKGQESGAVSELQGLLNRAGSELTTDGKFGTNTDRAIRDFQSANGLKVDGLVGSDTLRALTGAPASNNVNRANPTQPIQPAPANNGTGGIQGNFNYTQNTQGIAAARRTELGRKVQSEMPKHLETYKRASQLTGVPADLIAAVHANESQFGTYGPSARGPESGFGLDPRYVSTNWGNDKLGKYNLGSWQRGQTSERGVFQSAVIAAEHLKRQAGYAGVTLKQNMSQNELAGAVTGYVQGNRAGQRANRSGESWLFRPSDANPHPRHPGGTSIGRNGQTIRVAAARKPGLLRWDTLLPLISEKMW